MINLEFKTFEEISENLEIVTDAVNEALFDNESIAEIIIDNKKYKININSDVFKAGVLYGLSISNNI